jgi:ribonucleotide monophosphatase NagD (HAD superfamily)
VLYCGKPYAPIYEAALAKAAMLRGKPTPLDRVLAIGDSVRTDLKGAASFGLDCLFVVSGLHADDAGGHGAPDLAGLNATFAAAGVAPKAIMRRLAW